MAGRMFPFITKTWNPIKYCSHHCTYGWCQKYLDPSPKLYEERLNQKFTDKDFVFVCDCGDLFCPGIPDEWIEQIIAVTKRNPKAQFLFLTKSPDRMREWVRDMGNNCIIGATIESNRHYPELSKAPNQQSRLNNMKIIREDYPDAKLFVSIEPILDFDFIDFLSALNRLNLWGIAIGYDNYGHHLKEPSLTKTVNLELALRTAVYEKTIRKAWWEEGQV